MRFNPKVECDQIRQNLGSISFEEQRVLVTGGAGFLGSWMCDTLIDSGAFVTCIDNFASGMERNISHLMNSDRFRFINHDIIRRLISSFIWQAVHRRLSSSTILFRS